MSQERKIAFHEAGHAVIARVLGVKIKYVAAVRADGTGDGMVAHVPNDGWASDSDFETHALWGYAGPLAEIKRFPSSARKIMRFAHGDIESASKSVLALIVRKGPLPDEGGVMITKQHNVEARALAKTLWQKASTLVEKHWPAIERVAAALLDRKILLQDEVDLIIRGEVVPIAKAMSGELEGVS